MSCIYFKIKTKKYEKFFYCNLKKNKISFEDCSLCKNKEFKKMKSIQIRTIKRTSTKKSRRSKATDIPKKVKKAVFIRDNGKCVICGNSVNVMPNAHYISRENGGLGIEENIVTLCTELTENKCHRKYDFGTKEQHEYYKVKIRDYLKSKYSNWKEEDLIYKKYIREENKNGNL